MNENSQKVKYSGFLQINLKMKNSFNLTFIFITFFVYKDYGQYSNRTEDAIVWKSISRYNFVDISKEKEILDLEQNIASTKKFIKELLRNENDGSPKGTFETTAEYELRHKRFLKKNDSLEFKYMLPLMEQLNLQTRYYIKDFPSELQVLLNTENYNADNGIWRIGIIDPITKNIEYFNLYIPVRDAEQLWSTKNMWKISSARKLINKKGSIFFVIDIPEFHDQPKKELLLERQDRRLLNFIPKTDFVDENNRVQSPLPRKIDSDSVLIFDKVEIEAEFPGGTMGWTQYVTRELERNLDTLQAEGQSGTVIVLFIVDKDGSPSNVRALYCAETELDVCLEPSSLLAKIVVDAIRNGPKWKPAIQDGRPVKAYRRQPVTFRLAEE